MIWDREDAVKVILDQPTNSLSLKEIVVKSTFDREIMNKRRKKRSKLAYSAVSA